MWRWKKIPWTYFGASSHVYHPCNCCLSTSLFDVNTVIEFPAVRSLLLYPGLSHLHASRGKQVESIGIIYFIIALLVLLIIHEV